MVTLTHYIVEEDLERKGQRISRHDFRVGIRSMLKSGGAEAIIEDCSYGYSSDVGGGSAYKHNVTYSTPIDLYLYQNTAVAIEGDLPLEDRTKPRVDGFRDFKIQVTGKEEDAHKVMEIMQEYFQEAKK